MPRDGIELRRMTDVHDAVTADKFYFFSSDYPPPTLADTDYWLGEWEGENREKGREGEGEGGFFSPLFYLF